MKFSDLLPVYLANEPRWVDLCDAIQNTFASQVDPGKTTLKNIRNIYVLSDTVREKIAASQCISPDDYLMPDSDLSIKQANLLGLRLSNPDGILPELLPNLNRNIGTFWFSKGLKDFADFVAYVFNTPVTISNMWTENYIYFIPEGNPAIGTPIWEGGTWYPTTHVSINYTENGSHPLPIQAVVNIWLDISNYNLVLHGIGSDTYMSVANEDDPQATYPDVALLDYSLVAAVEEDFLIPFTSL